MILKRKLNYWYLKDIKWRSLRKSGLTRETTEKRLSNIRFNHSSAKISFGLNPLFLGCLQIYGIVNL